MSNLENFKISRFKNTFELDENFKSWKGRKFQVLKTTGFGHKGDDDMSLMIHNKTDYDADSDFDYHDGEVMKKWWLQ